jgi:DNA-binding MarR family transcriptional regulator
MTITTPPPVTGQDLGMAQNATRALLDGLLARSGTDFSEWLVLRLLSQQSAPMARGALRESLAGGLLLHPTAAERLLERTAARGLVDDGDEVTLTEAGAARYRSLNEAVGRLTAELYRDFDPADLATTGRVLREVARRATALA